MKKIEWGNKELPNLPLDKLNKLSVKSMMDLEKLKQASEKWTGSKHTKETKKKQSAKKKGKVAFACTDPATRAKAAKTLSKGVKAYTYPDMKFVGEYLNTIEAEKALGISRTLIVSVARGAHKHTKGYTFEYIRKTKSKVRDGKKVKAFTYPDLKFVGEYKSLTQAGKILKVKASYISAVLNNNKIKSTGGYTFKYVQ